MGHRDGRDDDAAGVHGRAEHRVEHGRQRHDRHHGEGGHDRHRHLVDLTLTRLTKHGSEDAEHAAEQHPDQCVATGDLHQPVDDVGAARATIWSQIALGAGTM